MVLVMEIAAGGELYDYISDRKTLGEPDARRIFRQIATAIYYCHKVGTKLISNFKWILALSRSFSPHLFNCMFFDAHLFPQAVQDLSQEVVEGHWEQDLQHLA